VVRRIFQWLVNERMTLVAISRRLTELNIRPPKSSRSWEAATLRTLVKNTVYKGEFYAHRYYYIQKLSKVNGKEVTHKVERPRNVWIKVVVPSLITADMWDQAQIVMTDNRTRSLRNTKRQYLLVSLLYCADCQKNKMTIGGKFNHKITGDGPKQYEATYYRCTTRTRPKHIIPIGGIDNSLLWYDLPHEYCRSADP
jgi:site-specific DNA recombinase